MTGQQNDLLIDIDTEYCAAADSKIVSIGEAPEDWADREEKSVSMKRQVHL